MADRYVLILHQPSGELAQHITIETDLPQGEVIKRITDLALEMDDVRTDKS